MAIALNRAKGWLNEAKSIEAVRDARAIACGYETVIREKELAFDAQLSATEIVRRCERRIGELVRAAQKEGTLSVQGRSFTHLQRVEGEPQTVIDAVGVKQYSQVTPFYVMADAPDEEFEDAIAEGRTEQNLSRASVMRRLKGDDVAKHYQVQAQRPEQPQRSEWHRKTRHIDSMRILREAAFSLEAISSGLELCQEDELDLLDKLEHISSIKQSVKTINTFLRRIS